VVQVQEIAALDDERLDPKLPKPQRNRAAAGAAADDNRVPGRACVLMAARRARVASCRKRRYHWDQNETQPVAKTRKSANGSGKRESGRALSFEIWMP
jgi:hypothetical protein